MSDITTYKSVAIQELMSNLTRYKYNPSNIQRVVLDYLNEVTNGEVDIVDPTNPFVFLLESSAVNTALAISENMVNLRKQYPSLAQTEEELYIHLCDKDFVNRFAVPSESIFTVVIQSQELMQNMVFDVLENCHKACIPRDTEFKVNEMTFTLQYPIYIRKYVTGYLQITYDATIESPLQILTSNIIDYSIRTDSTNIDYIFFSVPVKQMLVESHYYNIQLGTTFSYTIPYVDQYYYCRVYQRNSNTFNEWIEIKTTHTDQVYDSFKATAVLKVYTNNLTLFIPSIYVTTALVSGDIRVDIYTTKGSIAMDLSNYTLNNFDCKLKAIDDKRDYNDYTSVLNNVTYYITNKNTIVGGTNGINFVNLRERVIFNSVGDKQVPITNLQIEAFVNNKGFDLIKNVDVVTNRVFLATKVMPKPLEPKLITSANIGIASIVVNLDVLRKYNNVRNNFKRITILSENVYKNDNGKLSILPDGEIARLKSLSTLDLVNDINNHQYLYTPYHYVLDNSQAEFEVRVYNLDKPYASEINFKSQNETLQLPVNTDKYSLVKTTDGFRLTLVTKSGNFYKQLEDELVDVQLGYYPYGSTYMAYIEGELLSTNADLNRVFKFDINTNFDIDGDHHICLTNSRLNTDEYINGWIALSTEFHIFYTTSSVTVDYVVGEADKLISLNYLPRGSVAVTHEKVKLNFGSSLKNLWTRSRTFASGMTYRTYPEDIPLVYDADIYTQDPNTGSIFNVDDKGELVYNILHKYGDTALDNDGAILYKHRKGDVMLDNDGKPVVLTELISDVEFDILFVDGKYYFATDAAFVSYRGEVSKIIDTWITKDLISIQDILLEQTKIYFYSKTSLVFVKVLVDDAVEKFIPSEQSLVVDLYVKSDVYNNEDIRAKLTIGTIKLLDIYVKELVVNLTEINIALKDIYGDSVVSLSVRGLGGLDNFNLVTLIDTHNRLCLKKRMVLQQDGTTLVEEDVTVNFFNVERAISG